MSSGAGMTGRAGMTRQQLCDEIDVHAGAWRRMLDQRDSAASRLNQLEHIHAQTAADLAEAIELLSNVPDSDLEPIAGFLDRQERPA